MSGKVILWSGILLLFVWDYNFYKKISHMKSLGTLGKKLKMYKFTKKKSILIMTPILPQNKSFPDNGHPLDCDNFDMFEQFSSPFLERRYRYNLKDLKVQVLKIHKQDTISCHTRCNPLF
jgi:hypothetical protein